MDITNLTPQQLRKAANMKERIASLEKELAAILGAQSKPASDSSEKTSKPGNRRRRLSAAARAAIGAAAKARWAKAKKAGKTSLAG